MEWSKTSICVHVLNCANASKDSNLVEIATGFSGEAKVESHYKRLQRFFREFELDYESIALMVVKVMKIAEAWVISIDRTTGNSARQCADIGSSASRYRIPVGMDDAGQKRQLEHP